MLINTPANAKASFVFAHGAGAGMDTPFMQMIAEGLAAHDIRVVRFEFPYMQRRRLEGKKFPPDRQEKLLQAWRDILQQLDVAGPLFIGGKSMGGRIAGLLAAQEAAVYNIAGLICLGYPFYPPKSERTPAVSRGAFLTGMQTPTLILQGERDSFGSRAELDAMPFSSQVQYHFLPDGDHSFKPRVKSGFTLEQNLQLAVTQMAAFMLR